MRLAVYTDYWYHRVGERVLTDRAFALFIGGMRPHFDRVKVLGRLSPSERVARYPIGEGVELVALPFYENLLSGLPTLRSFSRSLLVFWRTIADVDVVWLLGPHPLAIVFTVMAALRRRRVILGVRQDMPAYVRSRHPRRLDLRLAALVLEAAFRLIARLLDVVAIGPELAHKYRHARRVLEVTVSLVAERDLVPPRIALERSYENGLQLLAVGRIDAEKNPLMLADILARLNRVDARWRLVVCGEGELSKELADRLEALGQRDRADLRGYVPFGDELASLYRGSHMFVHTSWTEGLPQVLPEAFAAGLPVVTTDVGGIRAAVGEAALLVPAGDAAAAAAALRSIAEDDDARSRLVTAGHRWVEAHTFESETGRAAAFISGYAVV